MNTKVSEKAITLNGIVLDSSDQKPIALGSELELAKYGLDVEDLPVIRQMADSINPLDRNSVLEFGQEIADHAGQYADDLLSQVRNKDLEEAGQKLGQVVGIAKQLNISPLSNTRSRVPFIGQYIDRLKVGSSKIMGQFETTKEQIDRLITEIEVTQTGLGSRNNSLDLMFSAVKDENRLLGLHIAAGKVRLKELQEMADGLAVDVDNPAKVQEFADLNALIANLDIRIGNLQALQQSAIQTLPQIRILQNSNQVLVDKFHSIKAVTIPAWKRQFMLALGLNEQKNAVQLANTIDDTTNDLLRRNAELLHHNAVATTKANQRLVIDVDTLQKVQDSLINTVQEVIQIQKDGVSQRRDAEIKIGAMRLSLQQKLTNKQPAKLAQ